MPTCQVNATKLTEESAVCSCNSTSSACATTHASGQLQTMPKRPCRGIVDTTDQPISISVCLIVALEDLLLDYQVPLASSEAAAGVLASTSSALGTSKRMLPARMCRIISWRFHTRICSLQQSSQKNLATRRALHVPQHTPSCSMPKWPCRGIVDTTDQPISISVVSLLL